MLPRLEVFLLYFLNVCVGGFVSEREIGQDVKFPQVLDDNGCVYTHSSPPPDGLFLVFSAQSAVVER